MRVNRPRAPAHRSSDLQRPADPVLRLDLVRHPFGPSPAAMDAGETLQDVPIDLLIDRLRVRICQTHRVKPDDVVVRSGIDGVINRIVNSWDGPVVTFPPSTLAGMIHHSTSSKETLDIARTPRLNLRLDLECVTDLPANAMAIVDSPSNPLGGLLNPIDAVRLARACRLVVIDERHAEFAGFSLLNLSGEFENIIVLRSFENWAGIANPPCSWAMFRADSANFISLGDEMPERAAVSGAIATLENAGSVEMTLRIMREERSRLFRFLRKLSFMEPIPSWGPFISTHVTLASRELIVHELAERGVCVHAPNDPGLERVIRFGLESRTSMDRLRQSLLDIAPGVVA